MGVIQLGWLFLFLSKKMRRLLVKNSKFSWKRIIFKLELSSQVIFYDSQCVRIFLKKVLDEGYPNADRVMANGVLLPLHHGMTESMFNRFHATVQKFIEQYDYLVEVFL